MSSTVREMFSRIASKYDSTNDVLSFGMHRLWRRDAIKFVGVSPGDDVLDLCTGTGDLAFEAARIVGDSGQVQAIDFVPEMIEIASKKRQTAPVPNGVSLEFAVGDAMNIPFEDCSFDAVTIGFGIRNVDDPLACLKEIRRVLRENGRVLVLEFGQPQLPVFSSIYNAYSRFIMPRVGEFFAGDRAAYEYLPRTAKAFPAGDSFLELMRRAGFTETTLRPYMSGIAFAYMGYRLPVH